MLLLGLPSHAASYMQPVYLLPLLRSKQALLTDASTSSNALACLSHSAALRMSASRMQPLLLLYAKMLQCCG